ncbi:hypothetical protein [Streptacidiphilus sp. ASG 303]|uniref:hypothetical protein n=1 Tax=Streptacidiphilus sp. ASG 303 TaxID=2896847 RepID=UPI00272B3BA2|nr:hypothetical protein [Streptacidiphilus sp. ASG 303]
MTTQTVQTTRTAQAAQAAQAHLAARPDRADRPDLAARPDRTGRRPLPDRAPGPDRRPLLPGLPRSDRRSDAGRPPQPVRPARPPRRPDADPGPDPGPAPNRRPDPGRPDPARRDPARHDLGRPPRPGPDPSPHHRVQAAFAPLAASLARAHGLDPRDLEQAVWLRVLEHAARAPLPARPEGWLRSLTLEEFRRALAPARAETPAALPPRPAAPPPSLPAAVRAAVARLPARCAALMTALLDDPGMTYTRLAAETGIPRGSIGPTRSRCLACLRRLLHDVAAPR